MFLRICYVSQDEKHLDFLHYLEKAESQVYSKQHSYKATKAGLNLGHLTPQGFLMIFPPVEFKKMWWNLLHLIKGRISLFRDSS